MQSKFGSFRWRLSAALCGGVLCAVIACSRVRQPATEPASSGGGVTPTFNRDIAPILLSKCASCHRPGEAAPFNLLTYDDARRRASQIAEVTRKRFMPPWPPEENFGHFVGARALSDEEIQQIAAWADSGAPRGDDADLPTAPEFAEGWQLGTPDLVLESPDYPLAGGGGDQFRNFVIPVEIDAPRWVAAVELRPTNPRVTHHARLGIDTSHESVRRDAEDEQSGYEGMAWGEDPDGQLVVWAPGMIAHRGLDGTAWRLQPKTCLVLHTHLQPSGKQETAKFRIGLHFADEPPAVRPLILRIGSRNIDIPAAEPNFKVVDEYVLPVGIDVHAIFPHAHSLCKEIRVHAEQTDGTRQPLIWIKHFDEKWHDQYRYVKPVRIPRGSRLITEFTYDNTDGNVRNRRRPAERTVYGSNASDEMQDVYLQVTTIHADDRAALAEDFQQKEQRSKLVGYGKTLEAYPDDPWSLEGLASVYLGLNRPQDAVRVLEQRLKQGPAQIHSLALLGMAYLAVGDHSRAEELLRQSIEMDAQFPFSWFGLGRTLAAQNRDSEAVDAYRRTIDLAPALTEASLNLAEVYQKQEHWDDAAAACEGAIRNAPGEPNALLKLGEVRAHQGRYEDALKLLEEAHQLAPYTHPPKVLLAVYCVQNRQSERARALLTEAHAEQPNHPVPALFLGQIARSEQRFDDARLYLDSATSLAAPTNWPASHRKRFLILLHSERLKLAEQIQDEALARDALEKWIECEPENESVRRLHEQFESQVKQ